MGFTKRGLGGLLLGGIVGSRFFAQTRIWKFIADAVCGSRSEQEEKPPPTRLYAGRERKLVADATRAPRSEQERFSSAQENKKIK